MNIDHRRQKRPARATARRFADFSAAVVPSRAALLEDQGPGFLGPFQVLLEVFLPRLGPRPARHVRDSRLNLLPRRRLGREAVDHVEQSGALPPHQAISSAPSLLIVAVPENPDRLDQGLGIVDYCSQSKPRILPRRRGRWSCSDRLQLFAPLPARCWFRPCMLAVLVISASPSQKPMCLHTTAHSRTDREISVQMDDPPHVVAAAAR